mmetsp:Transcript_21759/g.45773  ORF Transcript_21759/g.45773 Transcript_21759/m.45773 type:complete len:100 (-) Transcript_21759:105-404(-)|eukprot:CAMPEP_0171342772 /NCGR_PEP_ID=MMETSP0878-20121228/15336_1 /TAXON_ID=67004 /ORGANISM="Thalassiosira weissflogii, Strain CCMP1336" /LENGTH=99 /DNA_ID=CAMNT_0011845541 /DNA_START=21 /DNA_END=320 /DNA_ORIENTATION=+
MATHDEKLKKLEEATNSSQVLLIESQAKFEQATKALDDAKSKLKALSPEAQQALQVNDTDLPELIEAKMIAETERDEAKKRYEKNQMYFMTFKAKVGQK